MFYMKSENPKVVNLKHAFIKVISSSIKLLFLKSGNLETQSMFEIVIIHPKYSFGEYNYFTYGLIVGSVALKYMQYAFPCGIP